MSKTLLKRRLNPFLIASTILVLSLLAGLSVMWQGQLQNVNEEKGALEGTIEEKNQRIAELENRTSDLQNETSTLRGELDRYTGLYEEADSERESLENEISDLESDIEDKENEISGLESDIDNLEDTITSINASLYEICTDTNTTLSEDSEDECKEWGHDP